MLIWFFIFDREAEKSIKVHGRKRKSKGVAYYDPMAEEEKLVKRIILSLTRPSYVLGLCPDRLRPKNQCILRGLVQRLMSQRSWVEASGVLSVYMQATLNERSPFENQFKFWV